MKKLIIIAAIMLNVGGLLFLQDKFSRITTAFDMANKRITSISTELKKAEDKLKEFNKTIEDLKDKIKKIGEIKIPGLYVEPRGKKWNN